MARYVDPDATGDGLGADWDNAYTTLQAAIDDTTNVIAGTTVYCRLSSSASETPSVAIDFDGNNGTRGAYIRYIGCNSSGVNDGTQYVIDWSTSAVNGWVFGTSSYLHIENFKLVSSAAGAVDGISGSFYYCVLNNVWVDSFPDLGFSGTAPFCLLVRCKATDNGDAGFYLTGDNQYVACTATGNATYGFVFADSQYAYGCIAHDNTTSGFYVDGACSLINCVIDGNDGDGIISVDSGSFIIGCRITNNGAFGLDEGNDDMPSSLIGCYFDGNGTAATDGEYHDVGMNGTSTNELTGTDANEGYTGKAADNFNLTPEATLRNQRIELP